MSLTYLKKFVHIRVEKPECSMALFAISAHPYRHIRAIFRAVPAKGEIIATAENTEFAEERGEIRQFFSLFPSPLCELRALRPWLLLFPCVRWLITGANGPGGFKKGEGRARRRPPPDGQFQDPGFHDDPRLHESGAEVSHPRASLLSRVIALFFSSLLVMVSSSFSCLSNNNVHYLFVFAK
jgi:hypothetical protein